MGDKNPKNIKKSGLSTYIMLGLLAGVVFGWIYPQMCQLLPDPDRIYNAISEVLRSTAFLFLQMIKMIIAPLVLSTLVIGIAGHGNIKNIGNIGLKTIGYFLAATSIALLIGLLSANILQPGSGCAINYPESQLAQLEQIKSATNAHHFGDAFVNMIPSSIFNAMANNEILQIVVFSVFFALALGAIGEKGKPVLDGLKALSEVMFKFTEYVMCFAPLGVFAAISSTIGENGIEILFYYAKLIFSLYLALTIFVITVLITVCAIVKVSFINIIKAIKDPALLAFSTASSEAALPKAMETMENFGVPKKIVGFVMPVGYTFNLDGSTLYLSLAAIFIAQMYNIELSIWQQVAMMFALMLASKGMAAVPRVALVILAGTLGSFNIPVEGIAVLLGIDHILDMGRTTVNLIGNCVATVVVSRWEGAFDYQKMEAYMNGVKNGIQAEEPEQSRELIALISKNRTQNLSSSFD